MSRKSHLWDAQVPVHMRPDHYTIPTGYVFVNGKDGRCYVRHPDPGWCNHQTTGFDNVEDAMNFLIRLRIAHGMKENGEPDV